MTPDRFIEIAGAVGRVVCLIGCLALLLFRKKD